MSQKDRKVVVHCCVCVAPALMKEELSDVDDTASGTDWLMLNNQQYLMHCLQHRKKRRSSIYALRSVCHWCTHVVLLNRVMNKILSSDNVCVCVCVVQSITLTSKCMFVLSDTLCSPLVHFSPNRAPGCFEVTYWRVILSGKFSHFNPFLHRCPNVLYQSDKCLCNISVIRTVCF